MIPTTINIAGHNFNIEINGHGGLENRICGRIIYDDNKIIIQSEMIDTRTEEVLAHEILHGLLEKSGMDNYITNSGGNAENVCCALENIFWRFLKDNTNFFEEK